MRHKEFLIGNPMRARDGKKRLGAALFAAVILTSACSKPEKSVTVFEDVTPYSGISYTGNTWGAAWGDFDGDGLPDLYLTDHLHDAKLYRNLGHGQFADVTAQYFSPQDISGDKHGAAWADFDNDGRLDLVQLIGAVRGVGEAPKRLFRNTGSGFTDVAQALGVANPLGRSRVPLWVDFNHDGLLDLFQGAETRFDDQLPAFTFVQQNGRFSASADILKFVSRTVPFCILTALDKNAQTDLVCRVAAHDHTAQIFAAAQLPMKQLNLLPPSAFEDIAAGDFDNDGLIDLFLARKNPPGKVAFGRPASNELVGDIWIDHSNIKQTEGFSFRSPGQITVRVSSTWPPDALTTDRVHIGKQGAHPSSLVFTLSPDTARVQGMAAYQPGKEAGVYIGFTPPDQWQVLVSGAENGPPGGKANYHQTDVKISSSEAITDVKSIGDAVNAEEAPNRLFMNRGGKLVEEGDKRGVNARPVAAVNVVAGDFDNDMHLDLFVLVSGELGKQENLLLLNRGDGHFDVVKNAGGAAGDRVGVGDSVTTVDFDGDGFLDLFISSGGSMGRSEGLVSDTGTYHLYHNIGNGNHWIEMDLQGTASNRDGIGARVDVTAGGVTQVRIQDGGVHNRGQNSQRLHFGLAKNTQIDKITVHWPSGKVQELRKVAANQILRIKEPNP